MDAELLISVKLIQALIVVVLVFCVLGLIMAVLVLSAVNQMVDFFRKIAENLREDSPKEKRWWLGEEDPPY